MNDTLSTEETSRRAREWDALNGIAEAFASMEEIAKLTLDELTPETPAKYADAAKLAERHLANLRNIRTIAALPVPRLIPNTDSIKLFFQCARCMPDKPPEQSPREWARLNCGWTVIGFQVWCVRCDCNIAHVDFSGHTFSANLTRAE